MPTKLAEKSSKDSNFLCMMIWYDNLPKKEDDIQSGFELKIKKTKGKRKKETVIFEFIYSPGSYTKGEFAVAPPYRVCMSQMHRVKIPHKMNLEQSRNHVQYLEYDPHYRKSQSF